MDVTYLAHGGQMTGDEMALMGGGLLFALLFPVAVLFIATRRTRKPAEANPAPPEEDLHEPRDEDQQLRIGAAHGNTGRHTPTEEL
ncbi:hypothetical protein HYG77_36335 (plasmid) [Rhodococcus sp. ZPP]|uniref:hypothetical protein n=1 Tax=Rhodococcus TaxID=1827 RepID=UPI001AD86778|nr:MULTISPECIES: hypothetical protein [Rhodococcus]MBO8150798.1 hypothetical protein [Rhodococcus erythropolis]QTJ70966.1 hypothetical protein HYG77_36335 [Rhodococcus sp. ZPP]